MIRYVSLSMIIAKDKENNLLVKAENANKNIDYICPGCLGNVILKNGEINRPHFAHSDSKECADFAENESYEHLKAKLDLFDQLQVAGYKNIELEKVIPRIKQRPDVFLQLNNGRKIAFEIQFSPISLTRLRQRTSNYQMAGIQVFWLLGDSYRLEHLDQNTIAKFLDFNDFIYLWRKNIQIVFNFYKFDFHGVGFDQKLIDFDQLINNDFSKINRKTSNPISDRKSVLKIQSLLIGRKIDKQITQELYDFNGKNVTLIPQFAHLGNQFGLVMPNWQWRLKAIILIEKTGIHKLIGRQAFINFLSDQKYFYPRSVDNQYRKQAAKKLIEELVDKKILIRAGDYLIVRNLFEWYDNLESKLNQINISI